MEAIAARQLDDTYATDLSGASRDFRESSGNTSFAFFLALGLIYLILAAQFESFRDPFIIMITVPLASRRSIYYLALTDNTFNIFSQIGMIMLIGLVTKNGILIVEFANQKMRAGVVETKMQAVIRSCPGPLAPHSDDHAGYCTRGTAHRPGARRCRHFAYSIGCGYRGRALLFSLILTLFVIPAMYTYLSGKKRGAGGAWRPTRRSTKTTVRKTAYHRKLIPRADFPECLPLS
jgi:multidrug efflux pump